MLLLTPLRVVAATPISEELVHLVATREPRIEFIWEPDLLPPMRHAGDHFGEPGFRRTPAEQRRFEELVDSADVLYGIPDQSPKELARTATANPRLKWVHTMAAGGGAQVRSAGLGVEHLGRIAFTTSAGVHAQPLAEYATFAILAGAKNLPRLRRQQADRLWSGRWAMGMVSEQKVLIVGLGSIGRATAIKLKALGAFVVGTSRGNEPVEGVDQLIPTEDIAKVAGQVDAIVVTLPGTPQTEGLISAAILAGLKQGVTLVSVGRGTVIDEAALTLAVDEGRIGFAALDVFEEEPLSQQSTLWASDSVLVSPHTAALNPAEDRLIAELFAENARRYIDGEQLVNRVDTVEFY